MSDQHYTVPLPNDLAEILNEMARLQYRTPEQQIAWLVHQYFARMNESGEEVSADDYHKSSEFVQGDQRVGLDVPLIDGIRAGNPGQSG